MSKLNQEKVNEFIEKMSSKSDDEILEIIKIRHDYQPEAAEAVIKIGLERGLIDENANEIQREIENSDKWHYELNGKRQGEVSFIEISGLIKNCTLDSESLVWKKGFSDWKRISETELSDLIPSDEPPPLTGNKVSNFFIWLLAFAPIIGSIIEGEFFTNGSLLFWFILNSSLAVLDDIKLKRAGHKTNNLVWAILLVPVYLWKRATLTKQSKSYFWVWIISFAISFYISTNYYPNTQLNFGSSAGSSEIVLVKNGTLSSYPNKTVEEAVNGFFGNPRWEKIIAEDGNTYVNVTGNITYMEKEVSAVIQFRIHETNNTFEINAFEINGVPQNNFILIGLLSKMYGVDSGSLIDTNSDITNDLKLENYKIITDEWGNKTITGTVKNISSNEYSYAQIDFNLYDKDGNLIGSTLDNINNFEPNSSWKFDAMILEENVKDVKYKGISGY